MNRRVAYDETGIPRLTYSADQFIQEGRRRPQGPVEKAWSFALGGFVVGAFGALLVVGAAVLVVLAMGAVGWAGLVMASGAVGSFIGARKAR